MLEKVKAFFSPPTFEDPEKTRAAQFLNVILIGIFLMLIALVITKFATQGTINRPLQINLYLAGFIVFLWIGMRAGYVKIAGILLIAIAWAALTFQAWLAGGVRDAGYVAQVIIILMASLLLGWKGGLAFAALVILTGWGFLYAEETGMIQIQDETSQSMIIDFTVVLGVVTLVMTMATMSLNNALKNLYKNEESLTASNRELQDIQSSLERRVAARTNELQVVAALSERLNAILDVEQLLLELVNQVKEDFGYYHAHVYTIDDDQQNLMIAAGAGEAGKQMKAQGHGIAIDTVTSLVAQAARNNQIVAVADVRESPRWMPNPLLPDTRSEMAVPIVSEDRVIGVLDVQQDRVDAFDQGDRDVLRSLATQVAIAFRNARTFEEVQHRLEEARETQTRYNVGMWDRSRLARRGTGMAEFGDVNSFTLNPDALAQIRQEAIIAENQKPIIMPVEVDVTNGDGQLLEEEYAFVAPIQSSSTVIGNLQVHGIDPDRQWTQGEMALVEAVVDEVARVAENLQLVDQTLELASRERLIGQISARMRRATDIEGLMQVATTELFRALAPDRTFVRFGSSADFAPQPVIEATEANGQPADEETYSDELSTSIVEDLPAHEESEQQTPS